MDLSATPLPIAPLKPAQPATGAAAAKAVSGLGEAAKRAKIDKAGKDYESAFLSIMLGQMMSGVKASTFGGGEGEEAFKSFLTDAMAKSMVRHGGVGLSKQISADMLKLQGLSPNPTAAATAGAAASTAKSALAATPANSPTLDIAA